MQFKYNSKKLKTKMDYAKREYERKCESIEEHNNTLVESIPEDIKAKARELQNRLNLGGSLTAHRDLVKAISEYYEPRVFGGVELKNLKVKPTRPFYVELGDSEEVILSEEEHRRVLNMQNLVSL